MTTDNPDSTRSSRHRRGFITALGSLIAGVLAGCTTSQTTPTPTANSQQTASTSNPVTSTPTETPVPTRTPKEANETLKKLTRTARSEYRHGFKRHGALPDTPLPSNPEIDWYFPGVNRTRHAAVKPSPLLGPNGNVIATGDTGQILSVSSKKHTKWVDSTAPARDGLHSTPAIANNLAYIPTDNGEVYMLNASDGRRFGKINLTSRFTRSPLYVDGLLIAPGVFGKTGYALYGIHAGNGSQLWRSPAFEETPISAPSLSRNPPRILAAGAGKRIYAWNYIGDRVTASRPILEWTFKTDGFPLGPTVIQNGSGYAATSNGLLYKIGLENGIQEETLNIDSELSGAVTFQPDANLLVVTDRHGRVYGVSADSLDVQWSIGFGSPIISGGTATKDGFLIGTADGRLSALSLSGDHKWSVKGSGWVASTPLVTPTAIYYTDRSSDSSPGRLYKLS